MTRWVTSVTSADDLDFLVLGKVGRATDGRLDGWGCGSRVLADGETLEILDEGVVVRGMIARAGCDGWRGLGCALGLALDGCRAKKDGIWEMGARRYVRVELTWQFDGWNEAFY